MLVPLIKKLENAAVSLNFAGGLIISKVHCSIDRLMSGYITCNREILDRLSQADGLFEDIPDWVMKCDRLWCRRSIYTTSRPELNPCTNYYRNLETLLHL